MKPIFFRSPEEFRAWLDKHHETEKELLVGFHKVATGKPSLTWPQSVDEALSFGWIDGVRRSLGDESYTIRFTPRKPTSIWSAINIRRVAELTREGRMRPAGLAAYAKRRDDKSAIYSYERANKTPHPSVIDAIRKNRKAWAWFSAQAPGYQWQTSDWVNSAKKEETRARRLESLIECSSRGEKIPRLRELQRRDAS
jgi:uncharacterized protein YdeI (YjbR/CyaY-like superfamily)